MLFQNDATVLVVDDDASVRRGVSRLAQSVGYAVQTFASPSEFLTHDLPAGPSCLVLDMCMDEMTGLDVQDALEGNGRKLPIIFLSAHGTIRTATGTIKRGAEDFLEKPFRPKELLSAIDRAVEHDRQLSAGRNEQDELQRRYQTLTAREQEVMGLVITGLLNKQVAAELGISEKTVKVHRARVMDKMQVESLAGLVHLAERMGVVAAALSVLIVQAVQWWFESGSGIFA